MSENSITAVFTSCARPDLLFATLNSFFRHMDVSIDRIIIVEDGPAPLAFLQSYPFPVPALLLATGEHVGQIAAIDYAYSLVDSEYIFHGEDDWEFYRPGFLRPSMRLLEQEPSCLQVWLRALNDTNQHPLEDQLMISMDGDRQVPWLKLKFGYLDVWNGFSFNPGLRRMSDYVECNGYGIHLKNRSDIQPGRGSGEAAMSVHYREQQRFAAILADHEGLGYVRHIGWNRTVTEPEARS